MSDPIASAAPALSDPLAAITPAMDAVVATTRPSPGSSALTSVAKKCCTADGLCLASVAVPVVTTIAILKYWRRKACCACSFDSSSCTCKCCQLPMVGMHALHLGVMSLGGYASYLAWKGLGGFGCGKHFAAYDIALLSTLAHPILMSKCQEKGCAPAVINGVVGLAAAAATTKLFWEVDERAGKLMIPALIYAALRAGCAVCCAKGCCKMSCGGAKKEEKSA